MINRDKYLNQLIFFWSLSISDYCGFDPMCRTNIVMLCVYNKMIINAKREY